MTAVAAINMAGSPELRTGVREQVDLPKVVPGNHEASITGAADSVDVGAVRAVGPQAKDHEAQSAGVCDPLDISGGLHTHHLLTH